MQKKIFLVAFLLTSLAVFSQISRVEPASWWVGMKYNEPTLLIYGKNISDWLPTISYKGVKVVKTDTLKNKNYLFLTLRIDDDAKPGIVKIYFEKGKKVVAIKDFVVSARDKNSANRASFSTKDAFCLIFPDRFSNGDTTNDVVPGMNEISIDRNGENSRHGGDIQGIINHLDYIAALGYTQIWNTPLTENNEPGYSYHGYATTDFYKIDPRFGTNELFKEMVAESRKKGMGVVWDVVLNHCGAEYYFIKDMPSDDWVNFRETKTRTNHVKYTVTDIYASTVDKKEYSGGWFDSQMADLNQRNPFVAKFLIENSLWWIEYAGLSGLRVDTYSYSDKDFLATWTKTILDEYPNMNIVGEENTSDAALTSYWQTGKKNTDNYQCYLPSLMDFSLTHGTVKSLTESSSNLSSWNYVYESVAHDFLFPHPFNQMIFPDNHDIDRFYSRIGKNYPLWKLGIALFMTMRGYPQFFYGTEMLMTNEKAGSDGQRRGDFYGGWANDTKNAFTGKGLSTDELDAQKYFSKLLNWRKNCQVFSNGWMTHYVPRNNVYVYFRYNERQTIMVVLNSNATDQVLDPERYRENIQDKNYGVDVISSEKYNLTSSMTIPKLTALVLELN